MHIKRNTSDEAVCVPGQGMEGDRCYFGTGTYSARPDVREITLIEQEVLDAIRRNDIGSKLSVLGKLRFGSRESPAASGAFLSRET